MPTTVKTTTRRDKHSLYQLAVQAPDFEVGFLQRVYRKARGKKPLRLREDFCGTALLAAEWVRRVRGGVAIGLDLDRPTLDWGLEHNIAPLGRHAERIELLEQNVLDTPDWPSDVTVAFNFSYCIFKERDLLLSYFKSILESLADDGIFVLDLYGGPEAQVAQEEERPIDEEDVEHEEFTYVWDQASYNPITGDAVCHIHFDFPDGTRMRRAFTYDWRLWSLPEIRDLLRDAGFQHVDVYWEGTDLETGEGNNVFRPSLKGDDSASWVTYIVAVK